MTASMSSWKSAVSEVKSRCGFCGETFSLWSDRNDHLSDHFKAGLLMKDWKGCRGLEPAVALLVENAIPPYLIGTEALDSDPFSASKGNTKGCLAAGGGSRAPTAFGALTADLGDYVRTAKLAGNDITDDALRHQARLILYGDDDPWNQTPADNNQWIEMFKAGYGLDCDTFQQQAMVDCATNAHSAPADPMISPCVLNTKSVSPFTAEAVQHAVDFDPAMMQFELNFPAGSGDDHVAAVEPAFTIPWSWQTPECLAEFRQLGLLPPIPVACDPMLSETGNLAAGCLHTEPATSATTCGNSLPMPEQVFLTPQNLMFAAPAQASSSGIREHPTECPEDDTLFTFDAEFQDEVFR
ncbi:unnamed protein product [Clonostachys solani]|uniref:C2H2-type domain-containing protein n=1 Tax=Clonostachys solani TaxID=160281 RepID=A0A9N9ZE46_9HYPO|nr:unnamed protein product [Clonostachys solani]